MRNTGYYSHICRIEDSIKSYFKLQEAFLRKKKYFDVAYIDGYIIGLIQAAPELSKEMGFPIFYVFDSKPLFNYGSYRKTCQVEKKRIKAVYQWAKKEAKKYEPGIVLHHTPFLMGVSMEEV